MIRISVIILMGGMGSRFNSEIPKQFHSFAGKKIYQHTLDTFRSFDFTQIVLSCNPNYLGKVRCELPDDPRIYLVPGGKTRQKSSYLGLKALDVPDYVLIHEAVRPFVSKKIIEKHIEMVQKYKAVNTCTPLTDTLIYTKDGISISSIPNRKQFMRGLTPHSFSYPLILKAHEIAKTQNASEDCQLVLSMGHPVHIIYDEPTNFKITHEIDLAIGERIIHKS